MRRRTVTSARAAVLGCTALLVVVAGCSSAGSQKPTATPQHVTIAFGVKPVTLDPDLAFTFAELSALHFIGGNLYESRGGSTPVPTLASAYATAPNGLTQTYTLLPNLKFSDGSPLTARDVAATIERSINDKSNANAGFYTPIASVSAPSPHTVVFRLNRPYPSLPVLLTEPAFAILPAKDLNVAKGSAKGPFFDTPVSAGPYVLRSWGGGPTMSFAPNPFYVGPKPVVPFLKIVTIPDFSARVNELRSGQIDVAQQLPPALIPTLQSTSGIHVKVDNSYGWQTLDMWNGSPPLNDPRVRRAISLALNRDQLVRTVLFNKVPPLAGFFPSTLPGYDPSIPTTPNVAQAKRLLAGTACAHGCTLQLLFETDDAPWAGDAAVIIQSNLAAIGISTHLVHVDLQTQLSKLSTGKYQLSLSGIFDLAYEPDGMAAYGLLKNGGINANFSGYHSAQMDRAVQQAVESAGAQQQARLRAVDALFLTDQPFATLSDLFTVYATRIPLTVVSIDPGQLVQISRQK